MPPDSFQWRPQAASPYPDLVQSNPLSSLAHVRLKRRWPFVVCIKTSFESRLVCQGNFPVGRESHLCQRWQLRDR
jgi:hypothetical protein